jgi:hypothetical protein
MQIKRNHSKEIAELKGKLKIVNKHLKKRPISHTHQDFLTRRLVSIVQEISELEQSELYFSDLAGNPHKYN